MSIQSPIDLVAFDLDDTLAPLEVPASQEVAEALLQLLERVQVCVISGGQFGQFQTQVLDRLDVPVDVAPRLHLMPTCGTAYYRWDGESFAQVYSHTLTEAERDGALTALETEAKRLGLWESETWGPILEDRGSQITFSALGQAAPVDAKAAWDPTGERKSSLRDAVAALLPDLEVRSGGSTSVDITRRGVDKAFGMKALVDLAGVPLDRMFFVGDRLDEGGNDRPVLDLGVRCQAVHGWHDTVTFLSQTLLPELDAQAERAAQ